MDQRPVFTDLDPEAGFAAGGKTYVPAPVEELLQFNIDSIKQTEQIDNFKNKPDGTPNPNFGKPQTMYVVGFKLNDPSTPEANGQVYSKWISTAVSDKSNLGKISKAIFGSPTALLEHKVKDLLGMPLRAALAEGKKDPAKLVVDIDKLMKPLASQKRIEITADTVLTDIPDAAGDVLDAVNDIFGE